jgi:hypothetical protein
MSSITGSTAPPTAGAHEVNFVNNYYKPGPATTWFTAALEGGAGAELKKLRVRGS